LLEIAQHGPKVNEDGTRRDARPTTIRLNRAPEPGVMGRRPGLDAGAPAEIVRVFERDAIELLFLMPETCALDVADRGGATLVETAEMLGVTTAAIKEEVGPCGARLKEGLADYEHHAAPDTRSPLAAVQDHAIGQFL
jgi:hypothetical protein